MLDYLLDKWYYIWFRIKEILTGYDSKTTWPYDDDDTKPA